MNGLSCVKGEIHNVLAVLRITGRSSGGGFFDFGSSSSTSRENIEVLRHKLLTSFKELHLFLTLQSNNITNLHDIDTTVFIRPFCDVILSDGIRGIDVMNVTLTSIHKFLLYGLITDESIKSFDAINNILLQSIFNIKFDDNSRSDKELIHIRIMEILLELLRSSCGYLLSNDNVCLCVQKCFEIRLYHRNYHKTNNCLMVRYTENILTQMILLVFNKIKLLQQPAVSQTSNETESTVVVHSVSSHNHSTLGFNQRAMVRILKYLTIIINPNQIDTSPDLREFGLRLINVALETSGNYLNNYSSLIKIIQDDLCRQLLINSQSSNFLILSLTLRVIFDLFNYLKEQIRVQLEVFFISIHLRIAESPSSSFEQKELVLESIVEFCREPDLIVGLYTNYDCQVGSTHLFEDLCNFLLNKATIDIHNNGKINNLHLIAAEGILAIIDCIARKFVDDNQHERKHDGDEHDHEHKQKEYDEITQQQRKKRKLKLAARCFNQKLGKSLDYLQQLGTLQKPLSPDDVAQFLYTNPYLDKIKIGEFLGKKKEFNTQVLDCYVNLYDFKGMSPDEAMRSFLESFVLRGEAQQIERIIENFSQKLFDDRPTNSPLKSKDAAFLLSYSMIQLNTDAHNDQIKNKMTLDSYKRNLKGVNDGESFPDKFISKIYFSITNNEIKVRSGNFKDIFNANVNNEYYFDDRMFSDDEDNENDDNQRQQAGGAHNEDHSHSEEYALQTSPSKDRGDWENSSVSSSGSSFFLDPYTSTSNVKDVKKSEWMQILKKSQKLHRFRTIAPPTNGAEMFNILWEPALSILQFHLRYARHPKVLDRVVQGIQTLARIAHCYQIRSAFNAIMHALCNHLMMCLLQFGTQNQLLPPTFDSRVYSQETSKVANDIKAASLSSIHSNATDLAEANYASISIPYFLSATPRGSDSGHNLNQIFDDISQFVDEESQQDVTTLAIDIRITYTIKVFFDLVKDYGGLLMTDGWSSVMKVLLWLFHLDLIPHNIFEMEDFTDSEGVPLPSLSDPVVEENVQEDDSTVNALTSWISSAFGSIFTGSSSAAQQQEPHYLQQQHSDNDDDEEEPAGEAKPTQQAKRTPLATHANPDDSKTESLPHTATSDIASETTEQFIDPKCASIVNSVTECRIGEIFTSSKSYHVNSYVHLVRTLICLSNTRCNNTMTASSFLIGKESTDEHKQPLKDRSVSNDVTPSVTTHTITSLDPVPIQTSQLIDSITDGKVTPKQDHDAYYTSLLEEDKNNKANGKYANHMEDVICLPLTIDMKIFCLERMSQVLSVNINRVHDVWNLITDHFESLIMAQQNNTLKHSKLNDHHESELDHIRHSHYFFERISVNILKLCVELMESEQSNKIESVSTFLNLFLALDDSILFIIGRRIIAGIKLLLNIQNENYKKYVRKQRSKQTQLATTATAYHGQCFKQEKDWKIVCFLMKRFANNFHDKQCCLDAFHVIELISKSHLAIINFNYVINVLTTFGKHEIEAPIHNTRVIEIILSIHSRLLHISNNNDIVLGQMWHKTLSNIATFGTSDDYVTRRFAVHCLNKALLQHPIKIQNKQSFVEPLKLLFQTVLFPLLLQLTKVENERLSAHHRSSRRPSIKPHHDGYAAAEAVRNEESNIAEDKVDTADDLRLKLLTLLFQVWLHDMSVLIDYDTNQFHQLWYKFLDTIRKFILMVSSNASNNNLVTHCCESLKNVILVFQSNNLFDTLSALTNTNVWEETWKILNECAPNLKAEFAR